MSFTPKRPCPDPMNDSMEKRIKRISIEGNIGECCSLLQKSHLTKQNVQCKGLMSADGCQVLCVTVYSFRRCTPNVLLLPPICY